MPQTIVITGGAGFIGSHIADRAVASGASVRVVDNLCTGKLSNIEHLLSEIEFIEADIRDSVAMGIALRGADVVFHQAALASVPLSVENPALVNDVCVNGTLNLLIQARDAKVQRFVYAGSSSCYGNSPFAAKRESDELMTLSPYAVAKLAGERYCQSFFHAYGLETVILRYFNVFGPRQDPESQYSAVIPLFITKMLSGQALTVFGDGEQSRDFCFVQNIVDANFLAMQTAGVGGETFNISTGSSTSLLELIRLLERYLDKNAHIDFQPPRAGDVRHSLADISRAACGLDYTPHVSFDEGLSRSISFYRSYLSAGVET
ncbi:MAG: SDR family oxidoreductase [Pirellulaceae bacterium]|nr:SDR family oxidoreductase [Pirellulaceae bacterium]